MLHTKFHGNPPAGSREEDIWFQRRRYLKGFYHILCGGHLGHVTRIMSSNFDFLVHESFHTKFDSERHSSF